MASRALPDLIARIRVDSTGVDGAMNNLVGSFGRAHLAMAGLAAGIGLLVIGAKSAIDIAEKHDKATRGLAQAVDAYNASIKEGAPLDAHAADVRSKAADSNSKAQDALTISTHAARIAQLAYTDAVHKHGAKSEQALIASLHLQDANIRLAQAQDTAKDSASALATAEEDVGKKVKGSTVNLANLQSTIDDFIKTNRRYITDQAEVIDGFAKLTRSGLTQDEVQKDMNRAVDLAALKHISLSEATDLLVKAEQGRLRGLIDLGISTGKFTDAQGNLINGTKDVSRVMGELDTKLKGGRESLTPLEQASNALNIDWQHLALTAGPGLIGVLEKMVKAADDLYAALDRIGRDDHLWATISARLVDIGKRIREFALWLGIAQPADSAQGVYWDSASMSYKYAGAGAAPEHLGGGAGAGSAPIVGGPVPSSGRGGVGRAAGGTVLPGQIYTVGESAMEQLTMYPGGGGYVTPMTGGRSAGGDTYNFHQVQTDPWQTVSEISWAKKTRRL